FVMRVSPSLVESMLDDPGAVHGTCHPTSAVGACNRSAECFVVPPLVQKLRRLTQPLHPARPPTRRNLSEWRGVPLAGRTNMKRIAINTGGGDAPGLNAVIRAVALSALSRGWEVLGIRRGYQGLLIDEPGALIRLDHNAVRGILHVGGTILGTTNRGDPFHFPVDVDGKKTPSDVSHRLVERFSALGIDALVALGGDGSMTIARQLL